MGGGVYPNSYLLLPPADLRELLQACLPRSLPRVPRSTGARKTASSSSMRSAATATASAPRRARTSASTSTPTSAHRPEVHRPAIPRLEAGVAPACVRQCPGRVRHIDYMDNIDGHPTSWCTSGRSPFRCARTSGPSPTSSTSHHWRRIAFNEDGEFDDTQFAHPDGVPASRCSAPVSNRRWPPSRRSARRRPAARPSELMDILISRDWNDLLGPFTENPAELDRPAR